MRKIFPKFLIVFVVFVFAVSSVIAQNKPKMVVQKFEVKSGVQFSHENMDILMKDIVSWLKSTKKFGEVQPFSPPFSTNPNADFTPPTDYLMTGIITKHTSPGMFTKIMSYGMIDKTIVYLTFTVTDRRTGKEMLKQDVKGEINKTFLLETAMQPAKKVADLTKKAFKKQGI